MVLISYQTITASPNILGTSMALELLQTLFRRLLHRDLAHAAAATAACRGDAAGTKLPITNIKATVTAEQLSR